MTHTSALRGFLSQPRILCTQPQIASLIGGFHSQSSHTLSRASAADGKSFGTGRTLQATITSNSRFTSPFTGHSLSQAMADPSNDRTGKPFATFRDLPLELRLRVLEYTHLGPAWLAGYDPGFERLFIRDGKLEPGIFTFVLRRSVSEWFVCQQKPVCALF